MSAPVGAHHSRSSRSPICLRLMTAFVRDCQRRRSSFRGTPQPVSVEPQTWSPRSQICLRLMMRFVWDCWRHQSSCWCTPFLSATLLVAPRTPPGDPHLRTSFKAGCHFYRRLFWSPPGRHQVTPTGGQALRQDVIFIGPFLSPPGSHQMTPTCGVALRQDVIFVGDSFGRPQDATR